MEGVEVEGMMMCAGMEEWEAARERAWAWFPGEGRGLVHRLIDRGGCSVKEAEGITPKDGRGGGRLERIQKDGASSD